MVTRGSGGAMSYCTVVANGYRVTVWDDEKVLEIDTHDGCTTM